VKTTVITAFQKDYIIAEDANLKTCRSDNYNTVFNKKTGFFARCGKTQADDPDFSPIGPEIADIEITTSCAGVPDKNGIKTPCKFCYKSNTANGKYMTLETFKKIFANLPPTITQIAFGVDAECNTNPEWFDIFKYCKNNGIIPNLTVANISDDVADKIASISGAVAVSRYDNKDICYNTVKKLTDRGMTQVNIHHLVATEVYDNVMETLKDSMTDSRLAKLNAIVLLSLKKKGRGVNLTNLPQDKFAKIIDFALSNNIRIGFDSCSCHKFLAAITHLPENIRKQLETMAEPCESTCYSVYVDVEGKMYPCSFCEGINTWNDGIDMTIPRDFIKDIWYNERTVAFRDMLLKNKRNCPIYTI
jgi:hypothetical protein